MNTEEFIEQPHDAQPDPNRAVVPNPNYQSPLVEKTESNDQQVLPQVRASNTTYYYDVNSSAGAPQIFIVPPDAPPPPPGQAYQHVQHPLAPSLPTTTTQQAVVPPPPRVTTTVTTSAYQPSPAPPAVRPPQAQPYPQPAYEPREEVVRVVITDDRHADRDFYYYRDGTGAILTAWLLFGFGWIIGPLWWIGACFLGSKHAGARAAGVLNLIFGIFWIVTFITLLTWYY